MQSKMNLIARRRSIARQISAGVSEPLNLSTATIPVGDVTLISVSHLPPMTSMPTNSSPRALSSGASASEISRSAGVRSAASAVPPKRLSLTPAEREFASAPELGARLLFVGIDVIGGKWLTEINVTSPTGIVAVDQVQRLRHAPSGGRSTGGWAIRFIFDCNVITLRGVRKSLIQNGYLAMAFADLRSMDRVSRLGGSPLTGAPRHWLRCMAAPRGLGAAVSRPSEFCPWALVGVPMRRRGRPRASTAV